MPSLNELIEKIEAAGEGSRELSREIKFAALCKPIPEGYRWAGYAIDDRFAFMDAEGTPLRNDHAAEPFSTSVDAAMTLFEDSHRLVHLVEDRENGNSDPVWRARLDGYDDGILGSFYGQAATPALALCAAALKSRAQTQEPEYSGWVEVVD